MAETGTCRRRRCAGRDRYWVHAEAGPSACGRVHGRRVHDAEALPGRVHSAQDVDESLEDNKDRPDDVDTGPRVARNGEDGGVGDSQNHGGGLVDSAREALVDGDDIENAAPCCGDSSCDPTRAGAELVGDHPVPDTGGDEVDHSENDAYDRAHDGDDDHQHTLDAGECSADDDPRDPHYESGRDSVQPGEQASIAACGEGDAVPIAHDPDQPAEDRPDVEVDQRASSNDGGRKRGTGVGDQRDDRADDTERGDDERDDVMHRDHDRDRGRPEERETCAPKSPGRLQFTSADQSAGGDAAKRDEGCLPVKRVARTRPASGRP